MAWLIKILDFGELQNYLLEEDSTTSNRKFNFKIRISIFKNVQNDIRHDIGIYLLSLFWFCSQIWATTEDENLPIRHKQPN